MPITFACSCGKTLRVKDDHAGKWVRCPACKETAIVPEAEPEPAFEVVEDEPAPPPRTRVKAEPAPFRFDKEKPPPRPRSQPDQEYDGPRKARKKKRKPAEDEKPDHFSLEKGIMNSGVGGGLLTMVIAAVWFIVALQFDLVFYYPPILFVVGLIGFCKGLVDRG